MKSILEIYSRLWEATKKDDRFVGETFVDEVYKDCKPKLTVVDLGAFTGEFSFYCLPFAKDIYAVEPDPEPFDKLKAYLEEFKIPPETMKIFNFAIAGKDETRFMEMSHGGGSSLYAKQVDQVDAYCLRTFLDKNKISHVDILKIDVEGAEKEILAGSDFPGERIDLIIGEDHGGALSSQAKDNLKRFGFDIDNMKREGTIFFLTK